MIARVYLAIVGLIYLALGLWCAFSPTETSQKVGFLLQGDSGKSEFMTVYGGLEIGLGIAFLWPLIHSDATRWSLVFCLIIHSGLVALRTISLLIHRDYGSFVLKLAVGEWLILLAGLVVWWTATKSRG